MREKSSTSGHSGLKIPVFISFFVLNLDFWCPLKFQAPHKLMEQESQTVFNSFSACFCAPCSDEGGNEISRTAYWLELYGQQCYSLMVNITIKESLEDRAFEGIFEYYSPPTPFGSHKTMSFNRGRLGRGEKKKTSVHQQFLIPHEEWGLK